MNAFADDKLDLVQMIGFAFENMETLLEKKKMLHYHHYTSPICMFGHDRPRNHEVPSSSPGSGSLAHTFRHEYWCSSQEAESREISISCKNLFLNQCKINKLVKKS